MSIIQTCNILGINVAVTNMVQTIKILEDKLDEIRGHYICVSNVHTTVMAYEQKDYREIQNNAYMILPDGKPLSVVEKQRGFKEARKVSGPDLFIEILKESEVKGYTHYFYGSTQETLALLKKNLQAKFPNLKIVGVMSPPFRQLTEQEDLEVITKINETHPDFLWIGLGAPKQERWMAAHEGKIDSVMLGVGAAFAFHAGTFKRAPLWMQKYGLEWLYRLIQDPKRLWKRYLETNLKFVWYIVFQNGK